MEMEKIINLTPHTVRIVSENGQVVIAEYPSEGVARVTSQFEKVGELAGIPVMKTTYGETADLPAPTEGTIYIVSMVVANANIDRRDLIMPNTAPAMVVRDEAGQIFGVKSFAVAY